MRGKAIFKTRGGNLLALVGKITEINMNERCVIFVISPRTQNINNYWTDICKIACLSEKYGLTGVLLFTGNDTYLEPWLVAQEMLRQTNSISPLIAVNPVYMHPFTVAKMVASLVRFYGRKIYLNMVTGTALSYQKALGDRLSHDERYDRLAEYIKIVGGLLSSTRPLSFHGNYYEIDQLQLFPGIALETAPEFLLSGQSESAWRVCGATGSTGMQMLPARMEDGLSNVRGIHCGIVSRETEGAAWQAARALFPESEDSQAMLQHSMSNTDAVWKRRLKAESERVVTAADGYWLAPFANFQADCPYLVGAHEYIAERLRRLVRRGVTTFILDIPANEEEFINLSRVLQIGNITAL
jgi:alkanesulfonate monooxygenase